MSEVVVCCSFQILLVYTLNRFWVKIGTGITFPAFPGSSCTITLCYRVSTLEHEISAEPFVRKERQGEGRGGGRQHVLSKGLMFIFQYLFNFYSIIFTVLIKCIHYKIKAGNSVFLQFLIFQSICYNPILNKVYD